MRGVGRGCCECFALSSDLEPRVLTCFVQFFLSLYDYLTSNTTPEELVPLAQALLPETEGTLFDRELKEYERLADRAEELIVRHCVREVLGDLKTYLGR